jgi:hypothetical protein
VLAGTVIKGGNQDRQIGQDFIIGAKKKVPVDAYCVEHGRWESEREGEATGGKFTAVGGLAPTKVRAAGQYKENQQEVWGAVAKINQENSVSSESDTLAATLDDKRVAAERSALAAEVKKLLAARPQEQLVGIAWAVDGKVRAARWFMSQKLFSMYRDSLVDTAALEAVTARQAARAAGKPTVTREVTAQAVVAFVREIDRVASEKKATAADNVNEYRKGAKGAASRAMMRPAPKAPPAPVTTDYAAY